MVKISRSRSRNFSKEGAHSLFKKRSGGAWMPTHSQVPCLCKTKRGTTPSKSVPDKYPCNMKYTAIFLINGLCIVYCSLLQCLTLVYLGWGQKSELFCLLVTTRRLESGTVVGYHSTTTTYCWYTAAKGHWSTPG